VNSKTLQYLEQSMAHWIMARDALVFMISSVDKGGIIHRSNVRIAITFVIGWIDTSGRRRISLPETYRDATARAGMVRRSHSRRV
jgi:hypothetical protein